MNNDIKRVIIKGTGSYLPEKIMTNDDWKEYIETSDEWISKRTGIKERRIVAEDESTSDMGYQAALKAIESAKITPEEIDLIICATFSPDMLFPATACLIQDRLGAKNAGAFDLEAACSGFVFGVSAGAQFIASGLYKNVLVIGSDANSRILNWKDRTTCVLFGDGAGAVVLGPATDASQKGILSYVMHSDGSGGKHLIMPAGGSRIPASEETVKNGDHYLQMNGQEIYKFAVKIINDVVLEALDKAGLKKEDLDFMIPHQANLRIIKRGAKELGLSMDKIMVNLDKYGNTSSGTIGIALDEALKAGRIKKGDIVALVGFGGGLTWGSILLEWHE